MKKEENLQTPQEIWKSLAYRLALGHSWLFKQDIDPKHSSKVVKEWLNRACVEVSEWPSQVLTWTLPILLRTIMNPLLIQTSWCFLFSFFFLWQSSLCPTHSVTEKSWVIGTQDCYDINVLTGACQLLTTTQLHQGNPWYKNGSITPSGSCVFSPNVKCLITDHRWRYWGRPSTYEHIPMGYLFA